MIVGHAANDCGLYDFDIKHLRVTINILQKIAGNNTNDCGLNNSI